MYLFLAVFSTIAACCVRTSLRNQKIYQTR